MKIEKSTCWNVPCGFHQAIIRDARIIESEHQGVYQSQIRLILELSSLLHPLKKYVVKKTYKLSDAADFIKDMENLLGDRCEMLANLSGEIIPEALGHLLSGVEVDVEVEHLQGKAHDQPFCLVSQIKPRGSLIELLAVD
jgi:hypothetical protein